jgi:hypothetical protein
MIRENLKVKNAGRDMVKELILKASIYNLFTSMNP